MGKVAEKMVNKSILEKINKLLALANSPNENEAAIAAEKAAELLAQYNLTLADIGSDEKEEITEGIVETTSRYITWKMLVLAGIATANGCEAMRSTYSGKMRLVGTITNITVSQYLYDYLIKTVERLAKRHKGKGRAFLNAFRVGCATRLRQRLEQRRIEMEEEGIAGNSESQPTPAIVVRSMFDKNALAIEDYLTQEGVKIKTQKIARISSEHGFSSGYIAGDKISLDRQMQSGSSVKHLTGE